ncbi:CLUMA_CG017027, isoform A [Clunio marinus]|uniref:CLUMA_CG017027, isoform A n=1 Tax=Clunio marinus TaxID=568069 RepID=A0A1J1IWG4_9DIPT|nr:CLUMA_CG017027, isoform A [Clunio marinus]
MTVKEPSFRQGVAVPMTLEDYEKEIAREKELLNKAKKKMSMESSTPKDGISTWILLSGSHPTTRPEMKPAFRIDNSEKKPAKNITMTTKKRNPTTATTKLPKATPKYNKPLNKPITRVKVTTNGSMNETDIEVTTKATPTTKKIQLTTKAKKYTTLRPKTPTKTTTTTQATTTTTTEAVEVVDDDTEEVAPAPIVEKPTFLIMEPKDADFNLPDDRSPAKNASPKKPSKDSANKNKKKKKIPVSGANNTRIKKKSDKKNTKLAAPQKPLTTQLYNYLAREVMPTVGVGLVGLVVTAGLATYFLGGPLTALRRSYDVSNRRDDVAFDRSDDFGNSQAEEEMFGKVIAGMPENSAYRNNIRANPYRPKVQQYSGYSQYMQQSPKYGVQQHLRYRTIDPYQNSYQTQAQYQQYYQQQVQAQAQPKSAVVEYPAQQQQVQPQPTVQSPQSTSQISSKFNIDTVDMTTHEPEREASYGMEYDDIAQSYYPQQDETQLSQMIEQQQQQQNVQENEPQAQAESQRSEKITIVQAQSVPSNHRIEEDDQELPKPEALTMSHSEEQYQNSIANAIMNQQKQFVVGSVIPDHYDESPSGVVPEHGPRRRRRREAIRKVAKSLEDNEIEREEEENKRESDATTMKREESTTHIDHSTPQTIEESTTQYPTQTFNIENGHNNIFDLFRRIIDMKLRMGLNFLQNATIAFQQYLRGVEERVNSSPLFNPYKTNSSNTEMNETNKNQHKKYL